MPRLINVLFVLLLLSGGSAFADQPVVTVTALPGLGTYVFDGVDDPEITLDYQALGVGFVFSGDASAYQGEIDGHRAGWDVADPSDDNDPGWLWEGWQLTNYVGYQTFEGGIHSMTIQVRDTAGNITTAVILVDAQNAVEAEPAAWGLVKSLYTEN